MKFLLLSLLTIGMTGVGNAQSVSVAAAWQQNGASVSTKFDIDLKNVSFRDAIRQVISLSGVNVLYSPEILPRTGSVTYRASKVTASEALGEILNGKRLVVTQSSFGGLKIERAANQKVHKDGVIMGKVTDAKTGRVVSGANVSVDNRWGIQTSEDGGYRITGLSGGQHIISVRLVGYAKQTKTVTLGEGYTLSVDFKLESSANVLDHVVVTGTIIATELKAVPSAITVVTAKEIEERGITRIDQLFRGDIPGLFTPNLGSNTQLDSVIMYSRGATALSNSSAGISAINGVTTNTNPIKTYVDGVELANSQYLSQIDPSSIERIEILTGPQASTIYGSNALNGVMQIFTKRSSMSKPQIMLNVSSGVAQNSFNSRLAPTHIFGTQVSGAEGRLSYNIGSSWNFIGSWTPSKQMQRISTNGGGRLGFGNLTVDVSGRYGDTRNRERGARTENETELRSTGTWGPSFQAGLPRPRTSTLVGRTLGLVVDYRSASWWSYEVGFGSDISTTEALRTSPGYFIGGGGDTLLEINHSSMSRTSERYLTTAHVPLFGLTGIVITIGGDHWRTRGASWSATPLSLSGSFTGATVSRARPSKNSGGFIQGHLALRDIVFFYLWITCRMES